MCIVTAREQERERESEVVASTVTAACGEEGVQEVVASVLPIIVFLSHSDLSTVCGLPWFFPHSGFPH